MTKDVKAMFESQELRIANLEKIIKRQSAIINDLVGTLKAESRTETAETVESKDSKKTTETVVGNLIFSGKYVKTGTGFMNSKTRFAIMKSITENFGGTKLGKGNKVYDKCHKEDKYVQVYEFKTVADCKKFMKEQQKRVG